MDIANYEFFNPNVISNGIASFSDETTYSIFLANMGFTTTSFVLNAKMFIYVFWVVLFIMAVSAIVRRFK